MDDIVTELAQRRVGHDRTRELMTETADEIERLRTENAAMRRQALQNMINESENAGLYERERMLQRAVYTILSSDPTPMATLKDILKE